MSSSHASESAPPAQQTTTRRQSEYKFPGSIPSDLTLNELDLIPPSALGGKVLGVDYCLLAHNTDPANLESILQNGLKTLSELAAEPWTCQDIKDCYERDRHARTFGRDPTLIYTRLITPSAPFRVHSSSIVFAAHPDSVKVFNSQGRSGAYRWRMGEERALEEQRELYVACQLSYQDFEQRSAVAPGGLLNRYGSASPLLTEDLGYWPEVLLNPTGQGTDWLYFVVQHDQIPADLKWESAPHHRSNRSTVEQEQIKVAAAATYERLWALASGGATVTYPLQDRTTSA